MTTPDMAALAAEIEAAGKASEHGATTALLKGVSEGLNGLIGILAAVVPTLPLAKGKGADPAADPAADPSAKPAGGGGDADPDPAPGYEDMMFGRAGLPNAGGAPPPVETDPQGNINVTRFLYATGTAIQNLEKGRKHDSNVLGQVLAIVTAQQARIEHLEGLTRGSIEGQIRIGAPLAKAVADLSLQVAEIPAQPTQFRRVTPPKPVAQPGQGPTGYLGGSESAEKILLAKGLSRGILTPGMRRMYHLDRTFVQDPTQSAEIRAKVEALATAS